MFGHGKGVTVVVLFLSVFTAAQERVKLSVKSTNVVELGPAATYGSSYCDEKGNIFVAVYPGPDADKPLVKVATDGSVAAKFLPSNSMDVGKFFVSPSGIFELSLQHSPKRSTSILQFEDHGNKKNEVQLDATVSPIGTFGVFKNGNLLVAMIDPADKNNRQPYTAVFDANGKLQRRLTLEDDRHIVDAIVRHDEAVVSSGQNYNFNAAVFRGAVVPAGDNLLLLRAANPAIVYEVTPAGEVAHRFVVESEDPALTAYKMFYKDGQIAIGFSRSTPASEAEELIVRIKVIGANDGEVLRTFDGDRSTGVGLACFQGGDEFTFVGIRNKKMALLSARP